jgi:translation initiation factor IF-3
MMFRGREITRQEIAREIMQRIAGDIEDKGSVEAQPKLEGRNMSMIVVPLKSNG